MSKLYILDACSLIAVLADEDGSENVTSLIQDAINKKIILKMNQINLLEVYYYLCRKYNQDEANDEPRRRALALRTLDKLLQKKYILLTRYESKCVFNCR